MTTMMIMMTTMTTITDDDDHDDDDQDDHDEHEEEKSYQDLTNTMISWKNRILFDNKSEIEFTLGFSSNKRKEFGHHEEEGHDDHDEITR